LALAPGPRLRRALGPFERGAAEAYRRFFVDLGALVREVRDWTSARSILEVGCGEGLLLSRLAAVYPQAEILGIDPSPAVGRLFRGDRRRVSVERTCIDELARRRPHAFDLAILCDVLHHVPGPARRGLLASLRDLLAPGGGVVVKEWERRRNPVHLLVYLSDRYLTGDRVSYADPAELATLLADAFDPGSCERQVRIGPWRQNVAFFLRPRAAAGTASR
jgi:2-polyprenyl-3-methyl-5-hydroxy-6-metoxy-1,4-benzoquinol methylase